MKKPVFPALDRKAIIIQLDMYKFRDSYQWLSLVVATNTSIALICIDVEWMQSKKN